MTEKTLYINCCPRKDSRTNKLAQALLSTLGRYEELRLYDEKLFPFNQEKLEYRSSLIEKNDYRAEIFDYAKQFASADCIVIAAPFWDLSFPAQLKIYIENIYVTGIVSEYDENGKPRGLCKAKKLYYVTTSGGPYDERYSFHYIKSLALDYFGMKDVILVKAEMLDITGNDPEEILKNAMIHYGFRN